MINERLNSQLKHLTEIEKEELIGHIGHEYCVYPSDGIDGIAPKLAESEICEEQDRFTHAVKILGVLISVGISCTVICMMVC